MKTLVAYDGTLTAKDALRYGLHRVKTTGGELNVLHLFNSDMFIDYEAFNAEEIARRESLRYLEEARDIIQKKGEGVKVNILSAEGNPEKAIASYARAAQIELIIVPKQYAGVAKDSPCRVSVVPRFAAVSKVLLVDDEKAFARTLSKRLSMRDLMADVVFHGEDAISSLRESEPDVMILDLRMPDIDGMEVLRKTRQEHPDVQVIILTGLGTERDKEEAQRLGVFDFLKKTVDVDTLVEKVREAYWAKVEYKAEYVFARK